MLLKHCVDYTWFSVRQLITISLSPLKRSFILQSHVEEDCTYVGMMLTYLPGQTMAEIERSPTLLYDVGKFVGKLITSLQVC